MADTHLSSSATATTPTKLKHWKVTGEERQTNPSPSSPPFLESSVAQTDHSEEKEDLFWWLPDELLCYLLEMIPKSHVAAAARACRRWYACSPPHLRQRLSLEWAGSSRATMRWSRLHNPGLTRDSTKICTAAAASGNLDLLHWARDNGYSWDQATCAAAARNGHLEALKWARENGCPWNIKTCTAAAEHGHLEVLQWLRKKRCPWGKEVL
ncbi:Replication factor A/ankyrin repeat domain-containing protein, partial [Balamuthia mandrillaris]